MPELRRTAHGVCLAALISFSGSALAQDADAQTVEPEAIAAIDRMSSALRALNEFAFDADVTNEQVLGTGQKLQYGGTLEVNARKPKGLRIVASTDAQQREYYFDGESLAIVAPRLGLYASVAAPPTIGEMLDKASTQYGIEIPLADMFTWGSRPEMRERITAGYVIRPETVRGQTCMHYAFRQPQVDWQIWIDEETQLPCKLVITDTTDPAMPQYSALLRWRDPAADGVPSFTYVPGAEVHRIAIVDLSAAASGGDSQ